MTTKKTQNNRPDFNVFHVKDIGDEKSKWVQIGAAWKHKDGKGMNIDLDCNPVNGRIVLRTPKEKEEPKKAA